jgi:hypothetical protein
MRYVVCLLSNVGMSDAVFTIIVLIAMGADKLFGDTHTHTHTYVCVCVCMYIYILHPARHKIRL